MKNVAEISGASLVRADLVRDYRLQVYSSEFRELQKVIILLPRQRVSMQRSFAYRSVGLVLERSGKRLIIDCPRTICHSW